MSQQTKSGDYSNPNDLTKFQRFFYDYGRFHSEKVNIWIHIIFVPLIVFVVAKMLEHYSFNSFGLSFNIFWVIFSFWGSLYLYVDPISGIITITEHCSILYLTQGIDFSFNGLSHMQVLHIVHAAAWIFQFIGHGIFEKKTSLTPQYLPHS